MTILPTCRIEVDRCCGLMWICYLPLPSGYHTPTVLCADHPSGPDSEAIL